MVIKEIARAFSNGEFEKTYPYLTEGIVWTVVGEDEFRGKEAVIQNCEKVAGYFRSVTTKFDTLNVISEGNRVSINGTAGFFRNGKRVSFVSACDVYGFSEEGLLEKISSYCIQME